ncbi:hypothetical protein BDB01DRAFT_791621 [Pilobolus umbonatus]|nr:hypothetical protein BDB01DRAFT_791621 [Pilobolus umbonatus]
MSPYKCCCCFPVRAGVFTIALLSALGYLGLIIGMFMLKSDDEFAQISTEPAFAGIFYSVIAVSVIFTISAVFGLIGAITQHRKLVAVFKLVYWSVTILQLIISVAVLIAMGVKREVFITLCSAGDGTFAVYSEEECRSAFKTLMIASSISVVIINVIQIYFGTVISSYATRLRRTNIHEKLRNNEDFPEQPTKAELF